MFKDAATLDRQRTAASFDKALARYAESAETFFDGTAGSVDARLGACERLLHSARATVARLSSITDARRYLQAATDLESDRRALTALREDLLTGASGREDVLGPPGWRTATTPPPGTVAGSNEFEHPSHAHKPPPVKEFSVTQMKVSPLTAALHQEAFVKGAPFAGYKDFDACTSANSDKDNPDAYCGKIKHQVED